MSRNTYFARHSGGRSLPTRRRISVGNFTAGVWASVAVGEESVFFGDEIDIYAGYAFDVSETISADVGVTLYHYPQLGGLFDIGANDAGTLEVYGSLGFDAPLAPSVTAYYDFQLRSIHPGRQRGILRPCRREG